MKSRHQHWLVVLLAASFATHAQKYETTNGCDEGRWLEWDSIIISLADDPVEKADAIHVRDRNRDLCQAWKAGKITEDEAAAAYDQEREAWTKRRAVRRETSPPGVG